MTLTTTNHDRDAQGMTYVYAVVSRRSLGVSVGVNLNPNNACNWRCVYCQVPNLQRGAAPVIDLALLRQELHAMLDDIVNGEFLVEHAPPDSRRLNDVAISGNGEPTSSEVFDQVVTIIGEALDVFGLRGVVTPILITNGSLIHRPVVQRGLATLAELGGELWFKLDGGSPAQRERINGVSMSDAHLLRNLALAVAACPTKIQTCMIAIDGQAPSPAQRSEVVELLRCSIEQGARPTGVLLYGLARASAQPERVRLARLEAPQLDEFATELRALGLDVSVHA
jgi:wyosine [tRNA(Phe)-imidazoG37] synthetase (radical SAM superfamily)